MTEIFRCLAGSRLYGTHTDKSDHDYKAVHLPTKRQILLGRRDLVLSHSSGGSSRNTADDVDTESFELQRYLKLAADMQTICVEMLFVPSLTAVASPVSVFMGHNPDVGAAGNHVWNDVVRNRDKILNRNTKAFVGYCKGQAIKYSMRGKRLGTYEAVCSVLSGLTHSHQKVANGRSALLSIEGVQFIPKTQPDGQIVEYLDVYGRQVPEGLKASEALKVYQKPVNEAGKRAQAAKDAGGMDNKALYHAMRIVDEGISLFSTGNIEFPCQNRPLLLKIRAGEVDLDEILDLFDEKIAILEGIGDKSPLAENADREWIDDFVAGVYEDIVRA